MHRRIIIESPFAARLAKRALLAVVLLIGSLACARAAQPVVMPQLDEVPTTNSVFIDDAKFGRDPFYPKSDRRKPQIVRVLGTATDTTILSQILASISLKGISGLPSKRLAMLNNRTMAAGEQVEFKVNGQVFKLRCVEVKE